MQFMCLIYDQPEHWAALGPDEMAAVMDDYHDYTDMLVERGAHVGGAPLAPRATARTVRVRAGETLISDGPYAETKEHLGGYYLIEAAHLDEAIELASGIPSARWGTIEVRPLAGQTASTEA